MTSTSRKLAKSWPYPRYAHFQAKVRAAAVRWFAEKGFPVEAKRPYILEKLEDWPKNIILPEVSAFIKRTAEIQRTGGANFPLHKYIHHGLSSQAMLFNLVGPLIVQSDLQPLQNVLGQKGIRWPGAGASIKLEYEDREVFNESSGQPTSIDLAITDNSGQPKVFIESKFVETEFGGCSVFGDGDCDGRNPTTNLALCYLHHIGRRYWSVAEKHRMNDGPLGSDSLCVFAPYYQFFREVLFAVEQGGIFVLLSDDRSPVFHCSGPQGERGLMPLLTQMLPTDLRDRVIQVSVQDLVSEISSLGGGPWILEFRRKYGMEA